jgi:phosphoribosylformylglycinamidine synthase
MEDVNRAVSMDFKQAGDFIYIIGVTRAELGGSEYFSTHGLVGNNVPTVNPDEAKKLMDSLSSATEKGLVKACHDCSEGGLGVAVAEMAFAGGFGAAVRLKDVPLDGTLDRDDFILFSESNSRFLIEVTPEKQADFEHAMSGTCFAAIGIVTDDERVVVHGLRGGTVVDLPVNELKEAWQRPLRW